MGQEDRQQVELGQKGSYFFTGLGSIPTGVLVLVLFLAKTSYVLLTQLAYLWELYPGQLSTKVQMEPLSPHLTLELDEHQGIGGQGKNGVDSVTTGAQPITTSLKPYTRAG